MSNALSAFIFPGQGSQSVGMMADFAEVSVVRDTFKQASDAISLDLWNLAVEGPSELQNRTENTQPLLLTSSVALWRYWLEQGGQRPAYMAGHSLGEYSALVCSGVIELDDAVRLVKSRGIYMQEAVAEGAGKMAAIIGLDDDSVLKACEQSRQNEVVEAVNFNSPGQVVIAGHSAAVERAMTLCKELGAKRALPLSVSVPSHCALMKPAADKLAADLEAIDFKQPAIAVVNNVDVKVEEHAEAIKDALIRQLYSPVRWTETIQWMASNGVSELYECGAGNVLSGLARRIDRSLKAHPMCKKEQLDQLLNN